MSKTTAQGQATKQRQSLYQEITSKIIAELEAGVFPWARPWGAGGGSQPFALPRNAATGKPYSGINVLILWGRLAECSYSSQRWLTFRQAQSLGASVRKGENGVTVCYAARFTPKRKRSGNGNAGSASAAASEATSHEESIPFLRRYTVFNIDQCEGLPRHLIDPAPLLPEREIVPQADALAAATAANIRIGGAQACYDPQTDSVHVPPQPAFFDQINYYRTLFHELGHWTGHKSRLDRDQSGAFGSRVYANEELVAELTAAFVCAALSVKPTVRHADYIGSWLDVLRNDSRAIFRAASKATKAADFLLAFRGEEGADAGRVASEGGAPP